MRSVVPQLKTCDLSSKGVEGHKARTKSTAILSSWQLQNDVYDSIQVK